MSTTLHSTNSEVFLASYGSGNPFYILKGTVILTHTGVAIYGNASQAFTLDNAGQVYGYDDAIALNLGGVVINYGGISAHSTGVNIAGAAGTLTNFGSVIGRTNDAVVMSDGGVVNNFGGGTIEDSTAGGGASTAVFITGASGAVDNYGSITGDFKAGVTRNGVVLGDGGTVTNQKGGAINAGSFAVVIAAGVGSVTNAGSIFAQVAGVKLGGGGTVSNLAGTSSVSGGSGVYVTGGAGTVVNGATITGNSGAGIYLKSGGRVTNIGTAGTISGAGDGVQTAGAAGTVLNSGSILGSIGGVVLDAGGYANNLLAGRVIRGVAVGVGVRGGAGTVVNQATISASSGTGVGVYFYDSVGTLTNSGTINAEIGVRLNAGGSISNLAGSDTISGTEGIYITGVAATVTNAATIAGAPLAGPAIFSKAGGTVTNQLSGMITGEDGIAIEGAAGLVANYGTIVGSLVSGVYLKDGGTLANGGTHNFVAYIQGSNSGVRVAGPTTITNFGGIVGVSNDGVFMASGSLTNGSPLDVSARIQGGTRGVDLAGGALTNFGTIRGQSAGVVLDGGAELTNRAGGAIYGVQDCVYAMPGSASTVINYGTLSSHAGGVHFASTNDTLVLESRSSLQCDANGGGGELMLAGGAGTISGLFGPSLAISGSISTSGEVIAGFNTIQIAHGAYFALSDSPTVAGGHILIDAGSMSLANTLTIANGGTLLTTGALSGAGTLALSGGATAFSPGASLTVAKVTVEGTALVGVGTALAYAGRWTQTAATLSVGAGASINFTGTGNTFAGTLAGAGSVNLTAGTDKLTGTQVTAAHLNVAGAQVTLVGAITNAAQITESGGDLVVAAAGATLTGVGSVRLTNQATNQIIGVNSTAKLTVGQVLQGSGNLGAGQMTLVVTSAGTIVSAGTNALILNTGVNTITNAGRINAGGSAGLTIVGAVANNGNLMAMTSTLTVNGVVTGSGRGQINAGTLKFASSFDQTVRFVGNGGTLELADGQDYTASIGGFSLTGTTALELDDIAYVSGTTTASYSGTAARGVLTVTSGAQIAHIHFIGDYTGSVWTLTAGPGGGTKIVDPVRAAPASGSSHLTPLNLPPHTFIQAMAGIGARPNAGGGHGLDVWRTVPTMLTRPGTHVT